MHTIGDVQFTLVCIVSQAGCCSEALRDGSPCLGERVVDFVALARDLGRRDVEDRSIFSFEEKRALCGLSLCKERGRVAAGRARGFEKVLAHGAAGVRGGSDACASALFGFGSVGGCWAPLKEARRTSSPFSVVNFVRSCNLCVGGGKPERVVTRKFWVGGVRCKRDVHRPRSAWVESIIRIKGAHLGSSSYRVIVTIFCKWEHLIPVVLLIIAVLT